MQIPAPHYDPARDLLVTRQTRIMIRIMSKSTNVTGFIPAFTLSREYERTRNGRHPRRVAEAGPLRLQGVSDVARLRSSAGPGQSGLRCNPQREMLSDNR